MIPVILSGGSGSRLWPLSRAMHPKQFLAISGEQTLFQNTLTRLADIQSEPLKPIVVSNENHRFLVAEQCRALGIVPNSILLEPIGRNTAPAIAAAVIQSMRAGQDELLLVLPADHAIDDLKSLSAAFAAGAEAALDGKIVTFGIVPTKPETGYGYIRVPEKSSGAQPVESFVEKPDFPTAETYLADGRYYWNSGMFLFKASTMLEELRKFAPKLVLAVEAAVTLATSDLDFIRLDSEAFSLAEDISIDYAVMERSDQVMVVPLDAGWNDVGSWSAVWEISAKDADGNATRGDVLLETASNTYVHAEHRLVSVLGLDDVVVVETADAVMVASKAKAQDVKILVDRIKESKRPEASNHRKVYRPWGAYDSIDNGSRYQVKRITVAPGQKLSVQMHHHRAEHWIVVTGTAKVTIDDKQILLTENQSTYIPVGVVHALENPGKIPLEMIEVQSGTYLGEDDIVRFEDRYGRAPVAPAETI
ncbi:MULTISPECIES: mannose-1-phosphate guanylyltransferase/mannose-6-phosphate isomerase [Pseudomonas]|uniref:mannose-1-phosphate guanylyltransferase/mannose-6-phosphate isomerase n=1 Tax=Pseudomonas TaxID=286 RepID=UPI002363E318|nr:MULTISPECIES: mannose-1-phosphate guanylyltransferase/mannose-6-phosphate isomerase [Pseudomonas]MDD2147388.1 mannose-1-phosphate guanylyltransferase/mannose-6-phosphate isomerase [Pseudomonas putida]MDH0707736.1 mannose-1-phosphate guanylyltransferase/mannose-6-phosphate isomerase [Pseudomonas sp. GD03862]HDS1709652.1 mannose-1-phosphate guanylyltransferase/mannose-6-phosphate isomerase [Pseudomonas putida]